MFWFTSVVYCVPVVFESDICRLLNVSTTVTIQTLSGSENAVCMCEMIKCVPDTLDFDIMVNKQVPVRHNLRSAVEEFETSLNILVGIQSIKSFIVWDIFLQFDNQLIGALFSHTNMTNCLKLLRRPSYLKISFLFNNPLTPEIPFYAPILKTINPK